MKLSPAATEYLVLMGQMFQARLGGEDEGDILDKMDIVWSHLTGKEIDAMNAISKATGPISEE